jgi:hypothetical protein
MSYPHLSTDCDQHHPVLRRPVLAEIERECQNQDLKWGEQNHPDGTGGEWARNWARIARSECEQAAKRGRLTWRVIMREEWAEAVAETAWPKLRKELVQCAAVLVSWIEAGDRRQK